MYKIASPPPKKKTMRRHHGVWDRCPLFLWSVCVCAGVCVCVCAHVSDFMSECNLTDLGQAVHSHLEFSQTYGVQNLKSMSVSLFLTMVVPYTQ